MSARRGLKPLNSSTNLINHNDLLSSKLNLKRSSLISGGEKCEPKVSLTEQYDVSTPPANVKSSAKIRTGSLQKTDSIGKLMNSTNRDKQIKKKSNVSVELKAKKRAIKTLLSKEQRVKKWLTSKEPVQDAEYWRLSCERLGTELTEALDKLDELETENELLVAEYEHWTKLAKGAYKLNKLLAEIGLPEPSAPSKNNNSLTDQSFEQESDDQDGE